MKKFIYLSFLIFSLVVVSSSCKKDDSDSDSEPELENEFVLDGGTYSLSKGFIEDYGSNGNDSYDFDVTLTSSAVSYTNGDFVGTGDFIYLDFNSSLATGLAAGTYNFSTMREVLTFVDGTVARNFNVTTLAGDSFSVTAGTVEVAVNGTETTFTINVTLADGKTVTGYFRGVLETI